MVMRGAKRKGVRYFGPYAHAYAIRETLDLLLRTFPIRTCTKNKFDRHAPARPPVPLRAHREVRRRRASARSTTSEYDAPRRRAASTSSTATPRPILDRLDKQMHEAADELEFERAARLRDQIISVRKAIERQQMVDAKEEDFDAIGIVDDPLEASVQVFFVRKGRVVGRKGLVVDKVEDVRRPELVGRLLEQLYGDARARRHPARGPRPRRARRPRRSTRSSSAVAAGQQGARPRAAARRQARAAGDRHAERATRRSRGTS